MEKITKLETGTFLRDIRENKKVSRNDLKHICHANTLRNFEVGFNQINVEDFFKIYISLGYTNLNLLDILRLSKDPAHSKFFILNDKFENALSDLFQKYEICNIREVGEDDNLPLSDKMEFLAKELESFTTSASFEDIEIPLQQSLIANKIIIKAILGLTTQTDFKVCTDYLNLTFTRGQTHFTSIELKLLLPAILIGVNLTKDQLKTGNLAFEFICSKSIYSFYEEYFAYHFLKYLYVYENKKFIQLKRKYFDVSSPIRKLFSLVEKSN